MTATAEAITDLTCEPYRSRRNVDPSRVGSATGS